MANEIYAHIGRGVNHLKRRFSWLRKWITLVAKKDQENRIKEKKEDLITSVFLAVEEISATSSHLNLDDIANHLGVNRDILKLYGKLLRQKIRLSFGTKSESLKTKIIETIYVILIYTNAG